MIGSLRGRLRDREAERLLLDVGGVGYVVHAPASTLLELPDRRAGAEIELVVTTLVREDAITLYGFLTTAERRTFELLLGVSGVGPRTALAALSALGPEAVGRAIAEGDAARLATVPGIGRKTAERIVVDLRDRLAAALPEPSGAAPPAEAPGRDVVSALVNLGYSEKLAARAIQQAAKELGDEAHFDQLLREGLRRLSRG